MGVSTTLQRVRTSAWLGLQIEGNWADPTLFAIYVIARPLATAFILVAMYRAVAGAGTHDALFAGFYLANAFHNYVNFVVVGMGWAVFEEREEYETLKYVYASPVGFYTYLAGRSLVKFALATVSVVLILALGVLGLGIRIDPAQVQWLPLAASIVLGLLSTLFVGFLMAALCLVMTRAAITVIEGMTVAFYLLAGVIFPLDLLPWALRIVALALPFTWWYEALRRFTFGRGASVQLATLSDSALLATLAGVTALTAVVAWLGCRALERRARRLGRIDQTTLF